MFIDILLKRITILLYDTHRAFRFCCRYESLVNSSSQTQRCKIIYSRKLKLTNDHSAHFRPFGDDFEQVFLNINITDQKWRIKMHAEVVFRLNSWNRLYNKWKRTANTFFQICYYPICTPPVQTCTAVTVTRELCDRRNRVYVIRVTEHFLRELFLRRVREKSSTRRCIRNISIASFGLYRWVWHWTVNWARSLEKSLKYWFETFNSSIYAICFGSRNTLHLKRKTCFGISGEYLFDRINVSCCPQVQTKIKFHGCLHDSLS